MRPAPNHVFDSSILAAWHEQVAQATSLEPQLSDRQGELLPRFTEQYQTLRSLPRRLRRALQRHWKRSLAGVALPLALGATPAWAATIRVGGACTLVNAINAANNAGTAGGTCTRGSAGADTIVLPSRSTQSLTRVNNATNYGPTGLPSILSDITINGNNSTIRRPDSAPAFRIFAVGDNGELTLTNTTVSGGQIDGSGSGVLVDGGALTLTNTTISGNTGGGISASYGDVNVTNSTISNNSDGGVFGYESDITLTRSTISGNSKAGLYGQSSADISITNSTISGNDQGIAGGADEGLQLELTHSTITRNAREGIFAAAGSYGSSIALNRSLISGNRGGEVVVEQADYNEEASITAGNFNVFGYSGNARVTNFEPGPTDIVPNRSLNTVLNTNLANNGGSTRTHALPVGSPAIDTVNDGTCPPPSIDQRGVSRPRDGNGDGGPACDTGAFER